MEVLGANSSHKDAFFYRNCVHWEVLHTDKSDNRVDGGEVGNEVGEDVRDATRKLCVHETDARNTDQPKTRA